jgi:hypothetical protein
MTHFRLRKFHSVPAVAVIGGLVSALPGSANDKVHVTRFWHNHQPT